ncbi:MAG: hypothetical protein EOO94_04920 [Pedobacter sp.]|nr:MAG: hypothetical protein EOO94_04920 [Pedobacter sp.]
MRSYILCIVLSGLQLTSHAQATRPGDSEPIPSAVNFKTTSEGRWYNYVDYMTALDANVSFNAHLPFIWHNADIHCAYQSNGQDSFALVTLRSIGMVFDPISQSTEFNDPVGYPGEMTIRSGDSYFLDRVNILGKYRRNPAKGNIVDTLRFSFIYGLGPTTNLPHYYNAGQSMNFPGNDTVR